MPKVNATTVAARKRRAAAGLTFHAMAGRPKKDAVIAVFGTTGYTKSWQERAKILGMKPEQVVETFRANPTQLATLYAQLAPKRGQKTAATAAAAAAPAPNGTPAASPKFKFESGQIEVLARAVAGAVFGNATVQVAPQTREELWGNIQKGLETGIKQIGFTS